MKNISLKINTSEIILFHYQIPENINSKTVQSLISCFSNSEQQYFNTILNKEAQKRTLFGRMILRQVVSLFEINELEYISYTESGKPIFDSLSGFEFNISHSGNQVVFCIALDSPLGIDIEFIRPVNIEIYKDCFDLAEWQFITNSENPEIEFLKLWVRKEAVIKADGRGMEIELSSLNCLKNKVKTEKGNWYIQEVEVSPDFLCVIACNKLKNIQLIDFNSVFKLEDFNQDLSKQKAEKVI